ncbi:Uncharacterized protein TCM_025243 [Theobroma cacao]|uniref:RNase H type-1 domain-containing protein n=1 Tax=Theobroma cacao TaxID=3641 RepID=A0A061EYY3_THECC|nr:Uncharacterized protein TCM_025243 [Theobroma cacao]
MPNDSATLFNSWNAVAIKEGEISIWKMAFYTVVWSLWLFRNEIVFNGKHWDQDQLFELIKLQVASWAKAKWPFLQNSELDIYRTPKAEVHIKKQKQDRLEMRWKEPEEGKMKFNVDGAANGCPGEAGIASRWRSTHIMVVESDSKNAVQWINEPKKAPWRMRKWIFHIEMLKRKMVQWEVQHVSREANQQADNLAKSGIGRVQDLLNVLGEATNIND